MVMKEPKELETISIYKLQFLLVVFLLTNWDLFGYLCVSEVISRWRAKWSSQSVIGSKKQNILRAI